MAVGLRDTSGVKRVVNLTQLRRNKRKRPDKTSGRKRPRQADAGLIVVPAPDADIELDGDVEPDGEHAPNQPHTQPDIREDVCHCCDETDPPPRKNGRRPKNVNWVQCDRCPRWYHTVCVGVRDTSASYVCEMCELSLIHI